jgi:predicted LPLAT superfamily acyltransferase
MSDIATHSRPASATADAANRDGVAPMRPAGWASKAERGSMFMLRVMTWISLRLGRRPARAVLAGIAVYFVLFAPSARQASRQYLKRRLGRDANWIDGFRHVHCFASTVHDRAYLLNDREDLFDIVVEGLEHIEAVLRDGRGAFLLGAHFGSFEVLRALARRRGGLDVSLLMYPDNARKINAALHAINPHAVPDIISLGSVDSMLKLQQRLDAGAVVGMLGDRTLHDQDCVRLPFLGHAASWPRGPLRTAALLRRPVLFMAGMYLGGNRYRVRFVPLADFSACGSSARAAAVDAGLRAYVAQLEAHTREAPYNWFNFYDFWRAPAADAAGPRGR